MRIGLPHRAHRETHRRATAGRKAAAFLVLSLSVLLSHGQLAWSGDFYVNPIKVVLGAPSQSALLTLQNKSSEPLRFQLTVFVWEQDPVGHLLLTPTRDIIFFPRLLTLAPGEQRLVRVGAAAPAGLVERTYRLFVEELPPLETQGQPVLPGQVRVRARLGLPVFMQPAHGRAEPRLTDLRVQRGRFAFELRNLGTLHVAPAQVRVRGYAADGQVVWERELEGWYVLAKGIRRYDVELGQEDCSKSLAIGVEVTIGQRSLVQRLEVPPQDCAS